MILTEKKVILNEIKETLANIGIFTEHAHYRKGSGLKNLLLLNTFYLLSLQPVNNAMSNLVSNFVENNLVDFLF